VIFRVLCILILVAVVVVAVLVVRSRSEINLLKKRYRQISFLPPKEAEKSLQRQIERLKSKYPNRSEKWYLEKVIYDLERDRR